MSECAMDMGKRCRALIVKQCEGCSFRKTEEEFNAGIEHAKEILEAKGLRPVFDWADGRQIVTVTEI